MSSIRSRSVLSRADAVRALETNCWTMFSILGAGPGGRVTDTPHRLVIESPLPQPPYNSVMRFYDDGSAPLRDQVAATLAPLLDRGVAAVWLVHPTSPQEVRAHLADVGFVHVETLPGMVADLREIDLDVPDFDDVVVSEASEHESDAWIDLVSWRYGLDETTSPYLNGVFESAIGVHVRLWLARIDGEPVCKVGMHVRDGIAGIYGVATNERGRGRGLASALTQAALSAARDDGITTAVLHATPMAHALYERLGFRDVADFEVWAEPGRLSL